jgi:DNA-binding transcriptional LysR family regulator
MENWDDYRFILALSRSASLRSAANSLGVNHATVSRKLQQLNSKYGTDVFEPSPTGLVLSVLGKTLHTTALEIEQMAQRDSRITRAAALTQGGRVRISLPPVLLQFVLMNEIAEFQLGHPELQLDVCTSYGLANLNQQEADIVVRVSSQPGDDLVGHRLFPIALNYFANTDYLTRTCEQDYRWIAATDNRAQLCWLTQSPYPDAAVGLVVDDLVLRHQLAANGYGLIRGACYIANHFPQLTALSTTHHQFDEIWLLTHGELKNVERIKLVMRFLHQALKNKQGLICGE